MTTQERAAAFGQAADMLPAGILDGQRKLLLEGKEVGHVHSQLAESTMKDFEESGIKGLSVGGPADRTVVRHGLDDKHLAEIGRQPPTAEERRLDTAVMFGIDEKLMPAAPAESEVKRPAPGAAAAFAASRGAGMA